MGYFAGIGGQKCGTGWLYRYLDLHPQVLASPIKEMHVFDWLFAGELAQDTPALTRNKLSKLQAAYDRLATAVLQQRAAEKTSVRAAAFVQGLPRQLQATRELLEIVAAPDRDEVLRRYAAFFARRTLPEHRIFGEITPSYCLLPADGFEAILGLYPDARFVFVMRDPVDRFWSGIRLQVRTGSGPREADVIRGLQHRGHRARSDYRATLTAMDSAVPREQTLAVFYEDLFEPHDDSTLRTITAFVGIDYVPGPRETRENEGQDLPLPDDACAAVVRELGDQYRYVIERFGDVPERWKTRLEVA